MNATVQRPDFFIVGAPKSGTTALATYLAAHPDVFMPRAKEIHYFGSDLESERFHPRLDDYLALFRGQRDERRAGEASVWYLYSTEAAREIREFNPDTSIVVMLREPVELMYSLYHQLRFTLGEDLPTFEAALAAEPDRREGRRIPDTAHFPRSLLYREVVDFAPQVRRYLHEFGPERIHVLLFDQFRADTAAAYRGVLEFLGVDPSFRPDFRVVNPNATVRSRLLQRWLMAPPPRVRRTLERALPRWARQFARQALDMNTRVEPRPPLDPDLRARLTAELAPRVDELAAVLGRPLEGWRRADVR